MFASHALISSPIHQQKRENWQWGVLSFVLGVNSLYDTSRMCVQKSI